MTRCVAAVAIVSVLAVFGGFSARAQTSGDSASDQCFPWQQLRNGRCVAKPAGIPPPAAPMPPPVPAPAPVPQAATDECPPATHRDPASGTCMADAPATVVPPAPPVAPTPTIALVCNGGTPSDGACVCPAGFHLMSTDDNPGNGGTCVKSHAANCLGGELTVSGTCLCNDQVVMSGETYDLEYVNGKCVPKRCPEQTVLKDGRCLAISTTAAAPEPEPAKPAAPKPADEADQHGKRCGHGLVRTHAGCVPARRRKPDGIDAIPFELQRYYRN